MDLTFRTRFHHSFNLLVHIWPPHEGTYKAFHPRNSRMSIMKFLQDSLTTWFRDYDPGSPENASVLHRQLCTPEPERFQVLTA